MLRLFLFLPLMLLSSFLANPLIAAENTKLLEPIRKPSTPFVLHWAFMDFPPLVSLNEDGQPAGDLVTLMNKVSRVSGIQYQAHGFPNLRAIFNLNQDRNNFSIAVKELVTDKNQFVISAMPVATLQLQVEWKNTSSPIKSIAELKNKDLILLTGYTYGGLKETFSSLSKKVINVSNHQRAITALEKGRGEYALTYKVASDHITTTSEKNKFNHIVIEELDLFFILNSNVKDARNVMKKLEEAYLSIAKEVGPAS